MSGATDVVGYYTILLSFPVEELQDSWLVCTQAVGARPKARSGRSGETEIISKKIVAS